MPGSRQHSVLLALVLLPAIAARGEWRTDAGYFTLATELGGALPTGAGIEAFQCEALDAGNYLPVAMTMTPEVIGGRTYHALAGTGPHSGHASSVGHVFFNTSGISSGIAVIYAHKANDFFAELTAVGSPPVFDGQVQNHSWVGSSGLAETALRKYDFALDRDHQVGVVGLGNTTGPVPQLMCSSYHAIAVGVRSGIHSTGGTVIDGNGRMKPDLVVDQDATSRAAPAVASAAALLLDAIRPGFSDADHPQAVKALLLAGASKKNLPAWRRDASVEPYDDVFGAGELNILNSYHILAAGRQPHSNSVERAPLGWDYTPASNSTGRRYFFTVPSGQSANTFAAALVWHRNITDIIFNATLPNLTLKLFASTAFVPAASPIDQSNSAVDNVEHLFLRNLPPGQYMLEVTSNTNNHNYALAWEARLGAGPMLAARRDASGNVLVDFTDLDPFVTYTVLRSSTLMGGSWMTAGTFRTADSTPATTHTWQDTATPYPAARFYRIEWPSVR